MKIALIWGAIGLSACASSAPPTTLPWELAESRCIVQEVNPQLDPQDMKFSPLAWPAWKRLTEKVETTRDGPMVIRYTKAPQDTAAFLDVLALSSIFLPPDCARVELLRVSVNNHVILVVVP